MQEFELGSPSVRPATPLQKMATYSTYVFGAQKPIRKSSSIWDLYVTMPRSGNHKIVKFLHGQEMGVTIWCRSRGIISDVTPQERDSLMRILSYDNELDLENPKIPYEVAKALYKVSQLIPDADFGKMFAIQTPWVRNAGLLVCAEERDDWNMKILIKMGANVHDPKLMACLKTKMGWDEPREYARKCMNILKAAGAQVAH